MTTHLGSYYIVFLAAVLSLGIPLGLSLISSVFFGKGRRVTAADSRNAKGRVENRVTSRTLNLNVFLAVNSALILLALALELVPCTSALGQENKGSMIKSLIAIITVAGFTLVGLLYSVRKGDMGWIKQIEREP